MDIHGTINRYYPDMEEAARPSLVRALDILLPLLDDAGRVEVETKMPLPVGRDAFNELRAAAVACYSFDVSSEAKSRYAQGKGWEPYTAYSVTFHEGFARMVNELLDCRAKERRETASGFRVLSIDIETYSSYDIARSGVYKYVEAEDFAILLFAYSLDYGRVEVIDLAQGEELPEPVRRALTDPAVLKTAFNAAFERTCLSRYLGTKLDPAQWECTMVRCAMLGLPLSLAAVGKVLNLDEQKMDEGRTLIRYFSVPCRPTKANGGRTRNLPEHDPEKWETFKRYCRRDVEVENEIRRRTAAFHISEGEKLLYALDQHINDRGVLIDLRLVANAIRMNDEYSARLMEEAARLTGLTNPNSVAQLKAWLSEETGGEVKSLNKRDMPDIVRSATSDKARRILAIRAELGKTSVKKYEAMQCVACSDGRARGLLQFYGASRTGRFSGRLVQLQNLPQNHLKDLDLARRLVLEGDLPALEMLFGNVPDTLSQLIRTALVAREGCTFLVSDFSAIEARVIAWLADEEWRLEVFRTHGKIYEATAALMYHVSPDEITKTDPRRQKGKIAELACGYMGGLGAMRSMGGERMGLTDEEMTEIVEHWRRANPHIVALWDTLQKAATKALQSGRTIELRHGVAFRRELGALTIRLPSGRKLFYPRAEVRTVEKYGRKQQAVVYEGQNQTTKKWKAQETYGGKLAENIVQAIARDCLAITMLRLDALGYPIVFHVHDEVIVEAPTDGTKTLDEVCRVFGEPIPWAPGLPLKGAGYATKYYMKD